MLRKKPTALALALASDIVPAIAHGQQQAILVVVLAAMSARACAGARMSARARRAITAATHTDPANEEHRI